MGRLVMKFGGTSVANIDRIRNVAQHVKREVDAGHEVAVVVSAMSGKTNELVAWCTEASPMHDAREYDAVVASGEQVTSGLLAIVLQGIGIQARSWQGWQIPIKTSDAHASARILEIDGTEIIDRFKERKEVAVIAGFQGINPQTGRITTLGRGGSDTSAVAIAAALKADRCDIYTDVDGVYTTDPRVVPKARRLDKIAFEDTLDAALDELFAGDAGADAGDQNADPDDGDSTDNAIHQLLDHPRVNTSKTPTSRGAVEASEQQGVINDEHVGNSAQDTADFAEAPGNIRADYVLPSSDLPIRDARVFWPTSDSPLHRLTGSYPFPTSDHRLVWVDTTVGRGHGRG